nr:hypothetical protein [Microbispora sp. GKU 823]
MRSEPNIAKPTPMPITTLAATNDTALSADSDHAIDAMPPMSASVPQAIWTAGGSARATRGGTADAPPSARMASPAASGLVVWRRAGASVPASPR